jgi:outer membrane protein
MRLKLLPLLLCIGLAPLPSHGEDLMDSFRQAIANDPVLANSDATRLAVAEGVPQARSALLPQVSGELSLDQSHGGPSTGGTTIDSNGNVVTTGGGAATRDRNLNGSLSQSIFNLSNIANLRAAHSTDDAQQQSYQADLQNLYVRVASAYFNVLEAEDALDINKAYEDGYKQEFEQTSARFKNGLAMSADVNQAQAFYLYIKSQRISSEDQLKDARRALEQITGKPCGTLKKLREELPMSLPIPNDPKAWADVAQETNPTILAARYRVKADEHLVSSARAGHLPSLSAGVTYSKDGNWQDHTPGTGAYQRGTTIVGLTLTVPVFSGGFTQSKVRQAIYQRDADSDTLEGQRRQAIRDTYNYFNLVVDGVEQVNTARDSVAAAEKSLVSLKAGYEIGTQPLYVVVQAIEILAESRITFAQQRYQFVLNKLLLKQSAGTIDVHDLEDVNGLLQ